MSSSFRAVLLDQGRGIAGALLLVGLAFLYTMETWWLGWRLPMRFLLVYAAVGLGVVFVLTRYVGFRKAEEDRTERRPWRTVANFTELVAQSFVAAYVALLAFGVIDADDSLATVVRLGLIQVVPLAFGASLANGLLAKSEEDRMEQKSFPHKLSTFSLGAAFVAFPIAPTQEIELIALESDWARLAFLVLLSAGTVHLVLHELEFRGHRARVEDRSTGAQLGTTFVVYLVGAAVSVALLVAFGHFSGTTPAEWVQQTIVLTFPASVGASAGEVVL